MKRIIFIFHILLIHSILVAQNDFKKIELPINYARSFEFINNDDKNACLFFNLRESYCIMLLDSNYRVIAEFKDRFYTSINPKFVGSIANEERFELFFKRVDDDVLLVLIIDIESKKLTRVKDFKICGKSEKKIIYTGSNYSGNRMMTISLDQNGINFKEHLFGLKTQDSHIQLKPVDYNIFKKFENIQLESDGDSLIMLYRIENIKEKHPYYKIYNFDIKSGLYNTFDIVCNQKKKQDGLHCRFHKDIVFLGNCQSDILIYDKLNGDLIKDFNMDCNSIIRDENIKMLRYSYKYDLPREKFGQKYIFLTGEDRIDLPYLNGYYNFIKHDTNTYLKIFSRFYYGYYGEYYNTLIYIPFNWDEKSIIKNLPDFLLPFYDNIIYEIDIRQSEKITLSDHFWGFNNELLFGYMLKKSKEFVIEKVKVQ